MRAGLCYPAHIGDYLLIYYVHSFFLLSKQMGVLRREKFYGSFTLEERLIWWKLNKKTALKTSTTLCAAKKLPRGEISGCEIGNESHPPKFELGKERKNGLGNVLLVVGILQVDIIGPQETAWMAETPRLHSPK